MGQSHLPATGGSSPPWHLTHTVADVSSPRNDDKQGDAGSCLMPLMVGGDDTFSINGQLTKVKSTWWAVEQV